MATIYSSPSILSFPNATAQLFHSESLGETVLFKYKWIIITLLLVTPGVFRFLQYLLFKDKPPKGLKLVPGPPSTIPYIGRVDIDPIAPWNSMKKWADEYNGLFRLTTCGEMHIWLGDGDIAQELYCKRASHYSSRPEVAAVPGSHNMAQYLPLMEYGGGIVPKPSTDAS